MYISNYLGLNPELVDYAFPHDGFTCATTSLVDFMYFACHPSAVKLINRTVFKTAGAVSPADQIAKLRERASYAVEDDHP